MSKPINVCFATLNQYAKLANAVTSACEGSVKPTAIHIIDNGGKFTEEFGEVKEQDGIPIHLFVPKKGYSLASCFNRFLHTLDDYIIIANDDVVFHEKTIELLVKSADENPNDIFFVPDGYWEHYWSLFLQKKDSLAVLGEYDSNFRPAYYEDADMRYRMKLAGYKPFVVKECTYTHDEGGSNTIKSSSDKEFFMKKYAQLSEYYTRKWGGLRDNEIFTKPFNLIGD